MPDATQQLLHAMSLHLALRATHRRCGTEAGATPPDLRPAIAQAASVMTQAERRALQPHLEARKDWLAWSRAQLLRPGDKHAIARKQEVLVEADAERLLQSVQEALTSSIPRHDTRISAKGADVDDAGDVRQALQKAAGEIRTSGHWCGLGADLAPHLITSMPAWPKELSLRIEDKAGKWAPLTFGRSGSDRAPVTIRLDHNRQHYSPIVDGQARAVPAKGDCFYESVLRAMRVEDQRALFKGMRFPKGAGMPDLIRAMRRQVSEELERQINLSGGLSEDLRAHVTAVR